MELSYEAICFDLYGTLVEADGRPIAGARNAILSVPRERCAIVTSCGSQFARTLLMTAQLPAPPVLVASDDVYHGKPAPDGYSLAARRLQVDPSRILVFEDSGQGIAAARAAGMDVVGILAGRARSYAAQAPYSVERLADVGWSIGADGSIVVRL
ncbi:MAG: HAD-IA family hydrolase [Candidatus Eremiobacteraeota bacterium]|nr:HAD-IA family hydrolase [Candidatus Eremiobacteraeota bacterium]